MNGPQRNFERKVIVYLSFMLPSFVLQILTVTEEIEYFVLTKKKRCLTSIFKKTQHILLLTLSKHNILSITVNTISIDALVQKLQALEF